MSPPSPWHAKETPPYNTAQAWRALAARLRNLRPSTKLWAAWPVASACAVLLAWAVGATDVDAPQAAATIGALAALTCLVCLREAGASHVAKILAHLHSRTLRQIAFGVCHLVVLGMATAASVAALELPWNTDPWFIDGTCLAIEAALVSAFIAALYFLGQRRGGLAALGVVAMGACGIAHHYAVLFRGSAVLPSDLLALGTALSVSGTYEFALDAGTLAGITCVGAGMTACSWLAPLPAAPASRRRRALTGAANMACAGICAALLAQGIVAPNYEQDFGTSIDGWDPLASYTRQGLLTSFIAAAQDMSIKVPEGYTTEGAQALTDGLAQARYASTTKSLRRAEAQAQFAYRQPSVIAIMNETFSDLSLYEGLGYEGPSFFNSLETLVSGQLAVSAYGGGTCNSEFEFLTGNSLAFVGAGKYPYTLYDLSGCDSIVSALADCGYKTTAMHPNLGSNWSRDDVYAALGFDEFLTIEDFAGAETFHSGVTDRATYEKVLEVLGNDEGPQFIFDVTMQNHSAYTQRNIDSSLLPGLEPSELDRQTTAELNEYLACIEASDQDLAWLISELEALDRPVVLVFFGDHQPSFGAILNDAFYPGEQEPAHGARTYLTNYFIWANYDVAGTRKGIEADASASSLAAQTLELMGAPLTAAQTARLAAAQAMPMLNLFSYKDAAGAWHSTSQAPDESDTAAQQAWSSFEALRQVQYLTFAERVQ